MPAWAGRWKGGRYYFDEAGTKIFFLERRAGGKQRSFKLNVHDESLAMGELARFLANPDAYLLAPKPGDVRPAVGAHAPVAITDERIDLYLESIHDTVADHRAARRAQLKGWQALGLDLRSVDRRTLRVALGRFDGGHRGRTEALNAFARFLVKEGDLEKWVPLENTRAPAATRAARTAYSLEQLADAYAALTHAGVRDVFRLRVTTGLHHTEIEQLVGAPLLKSPLPDSVAAAVRDLGPGHAIRGVLQVKQKSRHRHRVSVDAAGLEASCRLREHVPDRVTMWEALNAVGLVPSNLRHTFVTLAGEVGELVTYTSKGVDRSRVAQVVGHREGSTMTADRYERLQVPPMVRLPLTW